MIQRLQSIFLLLASGACFGLLGTDAADSPAPVPTSELFADGSFNVFDSPVLIGAFVLAGVLLLANIFLYNNRPLQMKIATGAIAAVLFGVGFGLYEFFTDGASETATPDIGVALPILAFIFAILANRYIKADEKLVRSADRLR